MTDDPTAERTVLGEPAVEFLRSLPRHRHRLTREQVRASQGGRIIDATAEVIAAEGYAAATVSAIAERAGVSRKTFYELFEDKEAALLAAYAAVERLIDNAINAAAARAAETTTDSEVLAAGVRGLLQTLAAAPASTQMFFIEALGAGPRVRQRRDAAIEQVTTALTPLIAAARATSNPKAAAVDQDLVRGLVGAGIEAIVRHLVHHEPETLEQLEPTITKLAQRLLLAGD